MNFSGLVSAVREFWNFFWPAAICLALLFGVIRAVAPFTSSKIVSRLRELKPSDGSQVAAFKTLKRFGFDKLVPVVLAFCLLFAMDVAKTVVVLAGQAVPPTLNYSYARWFMQHSWDEKQRCLWAHYDGAPSLDDLQHNVDRSFGEFKAKAQDSEVFDGVRGWTESSSSAYQGFSACKFLVAWALLWAGVELFLTRSPFRPAAALLFAGLVFFLAGSLFLFREVWSLEQEQYARVQAVEVFLFEKPPACRELTVAQQEGYQEAVDDVAREAQRTNVYRWWTLRTVDSQYLHWVAQQLSGPGFHTGAFTKAAPAMTVETPEVGAALGPQVGAQLEEVQQSTLLRLAEASEERPYVMEDGHKAAASPLPANSVDFAQAATIVKSAITSSTLPQYAGKRILWVDDHPENNTYEASSFRSLGMTVVQVLSTAEALDALSREHPDVVITDMLRGTDKSAGYELLDLMRQQHRDIPTVVYSASSNKEFRAQAMSKGALDETNDPAALFQIVAGAVLKTAER